MLRNPEKLQLLHTSLLREYLVLDLLPPRVAYSLPPPGDPPCHQTSSATSFAYVGTGDEYDEELLLLPALTKQPPARRQDRQQQSLHSNHMLAHASERERVIDDFVIFCFLAGNDFLPHTFSTDIGEKGLDSMIACYRRFLAVRTGHSLRSYSEGLLQMKNVHLEFWLCYMDYS